MKALIIKHFFAELFSILKPAGMILTVEPPFHVFKKAFAETICRAEAAGFVPVETPMIFLSKAAVMKRAG